jgi:hypothetical protein
MTDASYTLMIWSCFNAHDSSSQEIRIKKAGLRANDYALLAPGADGGVAAINRCVYSSLQC